MWIVLYDYTCPVDYYGFYKIMRPPSFSDSEDGIPIRRVDCNDPDFLKIFLLVLKVIFLKKKGIRFNILFQFNEFSRFYI